MMVLRILGIVLCIVLLLGVSLTVFTLFAPARIEIKRDMPDGQLKMRLGFGPIKKVFRLGGKKKKKKKPTKKQEKKEKREEHKEETTPPRFDLKRLPIDRALELVVELIYDLAGAIVWERLHVTVILHTADAARTGRLLGACSAVVGNIYPYLERTHVLKDTKIVIDADFDAQKTIWGLDISVMTQLRWYPRMIWKRRKELWALWKAIRLTKEEREAWSQQQVASQQHVS